MTLPRTTARYRKPARTTRLVLQPLEDRWTPAAAFVSYTDIDGDLVKITASKPGFVAPPLDMTDLTLVGVGNLQLERLKLTEAGFENAKIVVSATKQPGGDGLVHVGTIDARFRDLNQVIVTGDLARIVAGDPETPDDPGLNLLQVGSMGTLGETTGADNLISTIAGRLGALKVAGDFVEARLTVTGDFDGDIGSIFIGGDLVGGTKTETGQIRSEGSIGNVRVVGDVIGGAGAYSGLITSNNSMGNVRIDGDVVGGAGERTGAILSYGAMGNVSVGGHVIGGSGETSGLIYTDSRMGNVQIGGDVAGGSGLASGVIGSIASMGNVRIRGDLAGGSGSSSGFIAASATVGSVRIDGDIIGAAGDRSGLIVADVLTRDVRVGGDLIGGTGTSSGLIVGSSAMGHVRIGGDVIGGNATGMKSVENSGVIYSGGRIARVTILGSLIAGSDNSTGTLVRSGAIVAGDDIGTINIGGSVVGNDTNPALVLAEGQKVKPAAGYDVAIASIFVKGNVSFTKILAGYDLELQPVNADASIGTVNVGGDWVGSSIVAGAQNLGWDYMPGGTGNSADFVKIGDGYDILQTANDTPLVARIKSINIKGNVIRTLTAGDYYGFVAQQIDKLTVAGKGVALSKGASNDSGLYIVGDVKVVEVS